MPVSISQEDASRRAVTNRAPVSVVIPCFNCQETIARAVQSIAAQTLLPREVILVDDASTDVSVETMRNLALSHPVGWIRIIELRENQGPGTARNRGWEAATSPLIAFLDADDAWHPRKVEIQYRWMKNNPNVTLTGHSLSWAHGEPDWPKSDHLVRATQVTRNQLLFFSPIFTPTIMVRRDEPLRFAAGRRYSEDHFLLLNMACSRRNVVLLHANLARLHKANFGAGGLSGALWAMERDQLRNYVDLLQHLPTGWDSAGAKDYIHQNRLLAELVARWLV